MIKTLEINYKAKNSVNDYYYLSEDENEKKRKLLPKKIEFTPGLNLVIGENGCGKTTLVDIITRLTLARGGLNNEYTFWDDVKIFYPDSSGFDPAYKPQDMFRIVNDYDAPVHRMDDTGVKNKRGGYNFQNFRDFAQFFSEGKMSKGQRMINTLKMAIIEANEKMGVYTKDSLFPKKPMNDMWTKAVEKTKEAIDGFNDDTLPKKAVFIMDEPDEGLDVDNLAALRDFLVDASQTVQIIVVLHNQLLIKSLANKANIIELSEGYLDKIRRF